MVATGALLVSPDLAVVGIRAWTTAGNLITTPDTALTALDCPNRLCRVYVPRHRRPLAPAPARAGGGPAGPGCPARRHRRPTPAAHRPRPT
ncbi:hypothetical protein BFL43_04270 [Williamsia sp. 1135]|nr:hypothetical protein BFL43_04270 [Williamsia sp. 1135]